MYQIKFKIAFLFFCYIFIFSVILSVPCVSWAQGQIIKVKTYPENSRKTTASKAPYNSQLLTAAHPTLAFGTKIVLFSPENQKSVTVEINDRCKSNMLITEAAGVKLGLIPKQVITVLFYNVPEEMGTREITSNITTQNNPVLMRGVKVSPKSYGIKVAQSNDYEEIKNYIQLMQNLGYTNLLCHCYNEDTQKEMYFRLIIGPFTQKEDAVFMQNQLLTQKIAAKIIELDKLK